MIQQHHLLRFYFVLLISYYGNAWTNHYSNSQQTRGNFQRGTFLRYRWNDDVIDAEIMFDLSENNDKGLSSMRRSNNDKTTFQELHCPVDFYRPFVSNNGYGNNQLDHKPQCIKVLAWMKQEGETFKAGDPIVLLEGHDEILGESHGLRIKKELVADQDGRLVKIYKQVNNKISYHDDFEADIALRTNPLCIIQPIDYINIEIDSNTKVDLKIQQERFETRRQKRAKLLQEELARKEKVCNEKQIELAKWKAEAKLKHNRAKKIAIEQTITQSELAKGKDEAKPPFHFAKKVCIQAATNIVHAEHKH